MGANPAELLHKQLVDWDTEGKNVASGAYRGLRNEPRMAIRKHEAALANWRSVGELLDEIEAQGLFPVDEYRSEANAWGLMILAYPHGWQKGSSFDRNSLRLLSTLGPQIRAHKLVPDLAEGSADAFERALDDVLATLKADPTIDGEVARYLLNLVVHMRLVIEEHRLNLRGDYDLARAATILKTTIDTAFDSSTDDIAKPRWQKLRKVFSIETAVQAAIQWSTVWPTLMLGQ